MPDRDRIEGQGRLSDFEKGQIIALWQNYGHVSKVLPRLTHPRPESTVRQFIRRYRARCSTQNLPTPGRPLKMSLRTRNRIYADARDNRSQYVRELRDNLAPEVSTRTVKRYLQRRGIRKWRAAVSPLLKPEHAAARLAWALAHRHWTVEDWERVIWSDECSVEKCRDSGIVWVFRSWWEKWQRDCINPKQKSGQVKLMVWACFWGRNRGTFVPIVVKSMDQFVYARLLETCMKPVYDRVKETLGDAIFMQDNASTHKAYAPMIYLTANEFKLEEWPPYSPDMNPIEHVWKRLKDKLHTSYPNLSNTRGGPEAVRARLAQVLPRVWEEIEEDFLGNLYKSMPDRIEALIEAAGWYTKY